MFIRSALCGALHAVPMDRDSVDRSVAALAVGKAAGNARPRALQIGAVALLGLLVWMAARLLLAWITLD